MNADATVKAMTDDQLEARRAEIAPTTSNEEGES